MDRVSAYVLLFLPWLVAYEAVGHVQPHDVMENFFGFERQWPVLLWTEVVYALTYPFVILAPLAVPMRSAAPVHGGRHRGDRSGIPGVCRSAAGGPAPAF